MKIDPYIFELYRFKVGAFFSETVHKLTLLAYLLTYLGPNGTRKRNNPLTYMVSGPRDIN